MKDCFNRYTDFIPEANAAKQYLDGHICYSAVDGQGQITGGAVVTRKGSVETEEFVFVKPEMRGKGIARRLREYSYAHAGAEVSQFISWVRDDNKPSWGQLLHFGYQDSGAYKITMMKG